MGCGCEPESGIDIVKIIVSYFTHRINVVHASINTKRCRTSQEWIENGKKGTIDKKEFNECMLAVYIKIAIVNTI